MSRRAVGRGAPMLVAVALLAGCASSERPPPAPELVGCYQLERSQGARRLRLPWGVVLTDEPLERGWPLVERFEDVRRALTATSATERADHPFGYWRPLAGDSVEVGHPGGGGVVLTLALRGRDLVGVGRAAGDALPLEETAGARGPFEVAARRVTCGAT